MTEVLSNEQVFNAAADLIRVHGFVKRSFGNYHHGFCAEGAIRCVVGEGDHGQLLENDYRRFIMLLQAFSRTILKGEHPHIWNDADERTELSVVRALRKMARSTIQPEGTQ